MKRILIALSLILIIIIPIKQDAQEPGGGMTYSAYFDVEDQAGAGVGGVQLKLEVYTWYGDELDPDYYYDEVTGTTDANGYAYLEIYIPAEFLEGLDYMHATEIDPDYSVLSIENTWTHSWQTIWPEFEVVYDTDGNGVNDLWENPLAVKFCPTLYLHSGDQGVRPVPVESMDRNNDGTLGWQDVLVHIYDLDGDFVGEYEMDEIWIEGTHFMYENYPYIAPAHKSQAQLIDNGVPGNPGIFFLIPHFEWGYIKNTLPEGTYGWYSSWSSFIQANSSVSKYVDGTTYAHLFQLNNETVIQYWFFYPFNPAANRHEGDWEHINVVLDSQIPDFANIIRVEYYFHGSVTPRYSPGTDYYLANSTHPKVFVGGYTSFDGYDGHGSHGSYPLSDNWLNINAANKSEIVDGQGLNINFANYQNVFILPNLQAVEIGNPNEEWMLFGGLWGYPISEPSGGDNLVTTLFDITQNIFPEIPWGQPWTEIAGEGIWGAYVALGYDILEETRMAPLGPAVRSYLWNKVYTQTGLVIYN